MPKPGPKQYECVRRAWHSERHQPIRGSLIREIFRVVSEVHSSATKRNKEWQEKLPIVVLRAEEILYSKANSEAEYMDLKTLWDRVNEAINIIIRLDDSAETGDLIRPCIEAALHLGCIPRRASRSQRNNDPRRYLKSNVQERLKDSITNPRRMDMNSDIFSTAVLSPPHTIPPERVPFRSFPLQLNSSSQLLPQTRTSSVPGHSVYPLNYWSHDQGDDRQPHCNLNMPRAAKSNEMPQTAPHLLSCDLSLQLGPCWSTKDIDMQCHHQEFLNTEFKIPNFKELHLVPGEFTAEFSDMNEVGKKRKDLHLTLALCPEEQMLCSSPLKLRR